MELTRSKNSHLLRSPFSLASTLTAVATSIAAVNAAHAQVLVVSEADVSVAESVHGGVGTTTGHRFLDSYEDKGLEFRGRVFAPGAGYGAHELARDQAYYIRSGRGMFTTDGTAHSVSAGMMVLVYAGTVLEITQSGDAPLSLIMSWALSTPEHASTTEAAPLPVVVHDSKIAVEEIPHGGIGTSTAYRYSDYADDARKLNFRRRTLHPGATIVSHEIPSDQGYYVLEGAGEITINGTTHRFDPGMGAYAFKGNIVEITPDPDHSVSYMLIEPALSVPERLATAPNIIPAASTEDADAARLIEQEIDPTSSSISLKTLRLKRGATLATSPALSDRVYYVLEGTLELKTDETRFDLEPGMLTMLKAGSNASFQQTGSNPTRLLIATASEK